MQRIPLNRQRKCENVARDEATRSLLSRSVHVFATVRQIEYLAVPTATYLASALSFNLTYNFINTAAETARNHIHAFRGDNT